MIYNRWGDHYWGYQTWGIFDWGRGEVELTDAPMWRKEQYQNARRTV